MFLQIIIIIKHNKSFSPWWVINKIPFSSNSGPLVLDSHVDAEFVVSGAFDWPVPIIYPLRYLRH